MVNMWINENGLIYEGDCHAGDRAATSEEMAAWELSKLPSPQSQIEALEREQLMPRATREFMLLFMETQFTPEVLALNPGYMAVKAFDNQIKDLRAQL